MEALPTSISGEAASKAMYTRTPLERWNWRRAFSPSLEGRGGREGGREERSQDESKAA